MFIPVRAEAAELNLRLLQTRSPGDSWQLPEILRSEEILTQSCSGGWEGQYQLSQGVPRTLGF